MPKCMFCEHYCYSMNVKILNKADNETALGICRLNGEHGNMTFGRSEACEKYSYRELRYERGDVFASKDNVLVIVDIQHQFAPNIYRVRSNFGSEWSVSGEYFEAHGYKHVWKKPDEADGDENINLDAAWWC